MFERTLVPIDFTASAGAALDAARENFPDAQRLLLHVLDPKRIAMEVHASVSTKEGREAMEAELMGRLEELARPGEECAVRVGTAAETIAAHAEAWGADLIVMGTHGRTGLAHFLNGSVAELVVRQARMPVLIEKERSA